MNSETGTPTIGRNGAGLGAQFEPRMQRASRLREMVHSPVAQSSTSLAAVAQSRASRLGVPPAGVAPHRADDKASLHGISATSSLNERHSARSDSSSSDADGGTSPSSANENPPPSPTRAPRQVGGLKQQGGKRPGEAWSDYYARRAAGN